MGLIEVLNVSPPKKEKENRKEETYLSGESSGTLLKPFLLDSKKELVSEVVKEVEADGSFDLDEAPSSLMDDLMADATEALKVKERRQQLEKKRAAKKFGGGLKKGFFRGEKKKTVMLTRKKEEKDVKAKIAEEVQENMKTPDEKDWLNEDLLAEMAKRPRLAKGLQNPKYVAAIEAMRQDPKKHREQMFQDNELRTLFYFFFSSSFVLARLVLQRVLRGHGVAL